MSYIMIRLVPVTVVAAAAAFVVVFIRNLPLCLFIYPSSPVIRLFAIRQLKSVEKLLVLKICAPSYWI